MEIAYQDLILLGIAASVLGGIALSVITTIDFRIGLFMGSAIATIFIYHAMFRNPPVADTDPLLERSAIVWHVYLLMLALGVIL